MNDLDKKSISVIRVFATILILCCHFTQRFENSVIQMSAQFFNVGVSIFLIISGYLYGKRKIIDSISYKKWLVKRAKRILIPLYIFLIILFLIYIYKGIDIKILNWLVYILDLQGIEIYLNGAEHLWYLTLAMICYFITIPLDMFRKKLNKKNILILFIVISISQVTISYFIYQQLGIYIIYIELYIIAYIVGMYWSSEMINSKYFINFNIILVISVFIRLMGRVFFDDTILYNILIVAYTQVIIGFSLFFIIYYLTNKFGQGCKFTIVKYLDSISYEVYLVHYMFIVGPISLMSVTSNTLINCFMVIICTLILSEIMHRVERLFSI